MKAVAMRVARSETLGPDLATIRPAAPSERARALLTSAKTAAVEHLDALHAALESALALASEVRAGGSDLYGPGPHELASRMAEELAWRVKTLQSLTDRQRAGLAH